MIDQLQYRIAEFLQNSEVESFIRTKSISTIGTSLGLVRHSNQDVALVLFARYGRTPHLDFNLAIVCDGLGGMKSGREAAILAASSFSSFVLRQSRLPPKERLLDALNYANKEVFRSLAGQGGTTLSAVFISLAGAFIGHVGDSRVYSFSTKLSLDQITQDDTLEALVKNTEGSSSGGNSNRLVQFVGIGDDLVPHAYKSPKLDTDFFLIMSDGAYAASKICDYSKLIGSSTSTAHSVEKILDISDLLGGHDNSTVVSLQNLPPRIPPGRIGEINLTFMSESDLVVWLPRRDGASNQAGLVEDNFPPPSADKKTTRRPEQNKAKKQSSKKARGARKPKGRQQQLSLSKEFITKVTFPNKDDDESS